jgi:UDP-N-acetylmuramoyl-tripeptide--D-alanyl-D-alanine ligase
MKPATLQQIRLAIGGKALGSLPASAASIRDVSIDTRTIKPGALFIAITGEHFDGHEFLPQAAAKGAVAAIVSRPPSQAQPNLHLIEVKDTRIALGKLAHFARQQMRGKVIAVAGSNGKTSTKYLVDSVLSAKFTGSMSPKSFNNDIGVPLTILPAEANDDYLVLELGTNHPGEIARLADIASPDIAIITNCGGEHLEFLHDLRGVRAENASIIKGLRTRGGMLIVNGDDRELVEAVGAYSGKLVTFGFDSRNDLFAPDVRCDERGTRFLLNGSRQEMFVPMLGRHAASNALAAIAVARRMGMKDPDIANALATARAPEMRLQLIDANGVRLINDAYNANLDSMRAAIDTLASLAVSGRGRRIAVLGEMLELGPCSDECHRELGEFAAASGNLDLLVCVGKAAARVADSALRAGIKKKSIRLFNNVNAAASGIPALLHADDLILIKASRGVQLELVANAIVQDRVAKTQRLRKRAS